MTDQPLEGVTVADFGQFIAGPLVGQLLSDLGARVVKVEPIQGDAARAASDLGSAMIQTNNRDKQSLALDLRRPEGFEIARRLLVASDVLIENMRPGAMDRLNLSAESVNAINPRLVYLSITAFGKGEQQPRPGLDIAAQAESGMMSVTGEANGGPLRVGFTVVDNATGYAATAAVLAALLKRERTGRGSVIDISLLEVAVHLQGTAWTTLFDTGVEPERSGNGYPNAAPAADVLTVRDGAIVVSAYTPAHWTRLCSALNRPDLVTHPSYATNDARVTNRAGLISELTAALASYDAAGAVEFLNSHGIVAGVVRSYRQVVQSEDAQRLDLFPRTGPDFGYHYPATPFSFRGTRRKQSHSAPALGADSRAVMLDLGYSPAFIDHLVASGVVGDPT